MNWFLNNTSIAQCTPVSWHRRAREPEIVAIIEVPDNDWLWEIEISDYGGGDHFINHVWVRREDHGVQEDWFYCIYNRPTFDQIEHDDNSVTLVSAWRTFANIIHERAGVRIEDRREDNEESLLKLMDQLIRLAKKRFRDPASYIATIHETGVRIDRGYYPDDKERPAHFSVWGGPMAPGLPEIGLPCTGRYIWPAKA